MSDLSKMKVFDRALVRGHRDRAASGFASHNALFDEAACQLVERLGDIKQDFQAVLDLGAHDGSVAAHFAKRGVPLTVAADISEKLLLQGKRNYLCAVADEELLPFAPESFDLIVSNLSLHWVNDIPGVLAQIKNTLKPGGLFLASFIGGASLFELRTCL